MQPKAIEGGAIRGHGRAWAVLLTPLPFPFMPLAYNRRRRRAMSWVTGHKHGEWRLLPGLGNMSDCNATPVNMLLPSMEIS